MCYRNIERQASNLKGAMMAVGASPEEICSLLAGLRNGEVKIACINSPSSVTISGDKPAVFELQTLVEQKQMFNRRLRVDVAYHSHHMNLVAKTYRASIEGISPSATSKASFHSSLLGHRVDGLQLQPAYWVENLTCSVRFSEALQSMCEPVGDLKTGINMIIELGPHSALEGPVKQILKSVGGNAAKIPYAPTLVRNKDASEAMLKLSASLFLKGQVLNFAAINFPRPSGKPPVLLTDMPRYPWNYSTRYWHDSRMSEKHKYRTSPRNDILGTLANYSNDLEPNRRNIIRTDDFLWLRHHHFQSLVVYPMAGYIVMALEAASQGAASRGVKFEKFELREVTVSRPLVISDTDIETTISLRSFQEGTRVTCDIWDEFRIRFLDKG
jgi:acyl transferase domain-containing protein